MGSRVSDTRASSTTRMPMSQTWIQEESLKAWHSQWEEKRSGGSYRSAFTTQNLSDPVTASDKPSLSHWGSQQSLLTLTAGGAAWRLYHWDRLPWRQNRYTPCSHCPCTHLPFEGLFLPKPVCKVWERWLFHQIYRHQHKATQNMKKSKKHDTTKE